MSGGADISGSFGGALSGILIGATTSRVNEWLVWG